jgi:uncharacterized protein
VDLQTRSGKIKVAVVTGGHPFEVPAFRDMFSRIPNLDVYIQDLDNFGASTKDGAFDLYDVFVFYNMHYWGLLSVRKDMDERILDAFKRLGERERGVLVLHHALLTVPEQQVWSDVCNLQNRRLRGYRSDEVNTHVVDGDHPITHGLGDWRMTDEVFLLDEPGEGSRVLLKTDHPQSMGALGWTHQYGKARVFCYQSGHGSAAYTNPSFQTVLSRGIEWLAGRI